MNAYRQSHRAGWLLLVAGFFVLACAPLAEAGDVEFRVGVGVGNHGIRSYGHGYRSPAACPPFYRSHGNYRTGYDGYYRGSHVVRYHTYSRPRYASSIYVGVGGRHSRVGYETTYVIPAQPVYRAAVVREAPVVYRPAPPPPTAEESAHARLQAAWKTLDTGDAAAAMRAFNQAAYLDPMDPAAKIGYALACGELGYAQQAERALERAALVSPNGFDLVPLPAIARTRSQMLINLYTQKGEHPALIQRLHDVFGEPATPAAN